MNHEQIAELEATADENECPTPQAKMPRPPNVSTKVQVNCSEKAENLSRWQLHRRKKKTVSVLKPVHCASGGSSYNMSKTRASALSRVPNTEKQMKARGLRPRAFICFSVFGTRDEARSPSF